MATVKDLSKSPINEVTFGGCRVLGENGETVLMSSLWKQQTALFVFLRHFGCIACRGHAAEIWHHRADYQKGGARIIFVGNGEAHYIQGFKEDLDMQESLIFTDPTLTVFRAAGFRRGFRAMVNVQSIVNVAKLINDGHRQTLSKGDLWQLGGMVVVKPSGKVAYHYISEAVGDYPPEADIAN